MARYRTGDHVYYRKGTHYPPYSVVEIPDDEKPSVTWTPIDTDPVEITPEAVADSAPEAVADSTPSTMSEMTEQEGRRRRRAFANTEV